LVGFIVCYTDLLTYLIGYWTVVYSSCLCTDYVTVNLTIFWHLWGTASLVFTRNSSYCCSAS